MARRGPSIRSHPALLRGCFARRGGSKSSSRGTLREVPYPDQVVCRQGEGEHPTDTVLAPVLRLPHLPHCLEPAEDLLDPFALPLTDLVSIMPRRSSVDHAVRRVFRRDVRRYSHHPKRLHHLASVVGLVGSERDTLGSVDPSDHIDGPWGSARPVARVSSASTARPLRFSIRT